MFRRPPLTRAKRPLSIERLESRTLLAADSCLDLSTFHRMNVNGDNTVSAVDALQVINRLNEIDDEGIGSRVSGSRQYERADVNQSGHVTALDALLVINFIAEGNRQLLSLANDTGPDGSVNPDRVTSDLTLVGTFCPFSESSEQHQAFSIVATDSRGERQIIPLHERFLTATGFQINSDLLLSRLRRDDSAAFFNTRLELVKGAADVPADQRDVIAALDVVVDTQAPLVALPDTVDVSDRQFSFAVLEGTELTPESLDSLHVTFENSSQFSGSPESIQTTGVPSFEAKTYRTEVTVPIRVHADATDAMVVVTAVLQDIAGNRREVSIKKPILVGEYLGAAAAEDDVLLDWQSLSPSRGHAFDPNRPAASPGQVVIGKVDIPEKFVDSATAPRTQPEDPRRWRFSPVQYDAAAGTVRWRVEPDVRSGAVDLNTENRTSDYRRLVSDLQIVPTVQMLYPKSITEQRLWNFDDGRFEGRDLRPWLGFRYRFVDDPASVQMDVTRADTQTWTSSKAEIPATGFQYIQIAGEDGVSEIGRLPFAQIPASYQPLAVRPNDSILVQDQDELVRLDFSRASEITRVSFADLLHSFTGGAVELPSASWIERIFPLSFDSIASRIDWLDPVQSESGGSDPRPQDGNVWIVRTHPWLGLNDSLVLDGQTLRPIARLVDSPPRHTEEQWTSVAIDPENRTLMEIEATKESWRRVDLATGQVLDSGELPDAHGAPAAIRRDRTAGDQDLGDWRYAFDQTLVYWDASQHTFALYSTIHPSKAWMTETALYLFDPQSESFRAAEPVRSVWDGLVIDPAATASGPSFYSDKGMSGSALGRWQLPELRIDNSSATPSIELKRIDAVAERGTPADPSLPSFNSRQVFRLYGRNLQHDAALLARSTQKSWSSSYQAVDMPHLIEPFDVSPVGTWADYQYSGSSQLSEFTLRATGQSIPIQHVPTIDFDWPEASDPVTLHSFPISGAGLNYRLWVDDQLVEGCPENRSRSVCDIQYIDAYYPVANSVELETPMGRDRFELPAELRPTAEPWLIQGIESFTPRFGGQLTYSGVTQASVLAGSLVRLRVDPPAHWVAEQGNGNHAVRVAVALLPDRARSDGRSVQHETAYYQNGTVEFRLPPSFAGGRVGIDGRDGTFSGLPDIRFRLEVTPTIVAQVGDSRSPGSTLLLAGTGVTEMQWTIDGRPAVHRPGPLLSTQFLPTVEVIVPMGVTEGIVHFHNDSITATSPAIVPWWTGDMPTVQDVDLTYPDLPSIRQNDRVEFLLHCSDGDGCNEVGETVRIRRFDQDSIQSDTLFVEEHWGGNRVLVSNRFSAPGEAALFGEQGSSSLNLLPVVTSIDAISATQRGQYVRDPRFPERISIVFSRGDIHPALPPGSHVIWGDRQWQAEDYKKTYWQRIADRPLSPEWSPDDQLKFTGPTMDDMLLDSNVRDLQGRRGPQLTSFNLPDLPSGPMRLETRWGNSSFSLPELPELASIIRSTTAASGTPADPSIPSVNVQQELLLPAEFRDRGDNLFFQREPKGTYRINQAAWTMAELSRRNPPSTTIPEGMIVASVPADAISGSVRLGLFGVEQPIQIVPTLIASSRSFSFTGAEVGDQLRLGSFFLELTAADIRVGAVALDFSRPRFADLDVELLRGDAQLISSSGRSELVPMPPILLSIEPVLAPDRLPSGIPIYQAGDRPRIRGINFYPSIRIELRHIDLRESEVQKTGIGPLLIPDPQTTEVEWEVPVGLRGHLNHVGFSTQIRDPATLLTLSDSPIFFITAL